VGSPDGEAAALLGSIAVLIGILHGILALAGYFAALWTRAQLKQALNHTTGVTAGLNESRVKLLTAVVGLVAAIIAGFIAKK
jgi:hypothetical protein